MCSDSSLPPGKWSATFKRVSHEPRCVWLIQNASSADEIIQFAKAVQTDTSVW